MTADPLGCLALGVVLGRTIGALFVAVCVVGQGRDILTSLLIGAGAWLVAAIAACWAFRALGRTDRE